MQVVLMGAAGDMGRTAADQLAKNPSISELVLADRDASRVGVIASSLAVGTSSNVRAVTCDVADEVALRRVLDRADIVVNCTGPFFRLGVPTLLAAIDTTTTYLDICDDPEPTIEMMALDALAREAGVAAVIGMGASPGVSNLLAARAARRLDHVRDCYTGWSLDDSTGDDEPSGDADRAPSTAVVHFVEQIHGTVAVVEEGVLVRRPPLEVVELEYPGLGRGVGYVVGHPEPVTLHGSLALAGRSCNLVLVADGATAAFLRGIQRDLDTGDLDLDTAARAVIRPSLGRLTRAAVGGASLRGSGSLPPLFALVTGTVDGREATVGCHVTAMPRGMAGSTAIPAALAVGQLITDRPAPGVHAPESVIDADRLLNDLIPFCATPVADVDALAPVQISFADEPRAEGPR